MGRPPEHDERTRAELLTEAGRILAAEGAGAVTVRRVSQAAGTTTRAVYSLFGDKEGLLRALYHDAAEVMRRHHEAVPPHDDPLVEVTALALAYRAAAQEQPHVYGLLMNATAVGFQATESDRQLAARSFRRVLAALHRFADAGLFPGRDPRAIGLQLWAQVHGLASLELQGHLGPPEEAERRWRDAIGAHIWAYRNPPSSGAALTQP